MLPPNHYLSVAIFYHQHRPKWSKDAAVGKTVVSSQMIDCVTAKLGRKLYEVPVGFKWFVDGLLNGSLGLGGEESAGASFIRLDETYVQQRCAIDNPLRFAGYGRPCWGITASDGPGPDTIKLNGIERQFFGYLGRGVPYGPDDGTHRAVGGGDIAAVRA